MTSEFIPGKLYKLTTYAVGFHKSPDTVFDGNSKSSNWIRYDFHDMFLFVEAEKEKPFFTWLAPDGKVVYLKRSHSIEFMKRP